MSANPMKPSNAACAFAFVAAELLALPGLAIGLYAYTVGRVGARGGWLSSLFELLFSGFVLLPVVLLCLIALLFAGAFASARPWAAITLIIINVAVVVVAWPILGPKTAGELLVWVPAFISLAIASWLAWRGFAS